MADIKEFTISDDAKRQLGHIIREIRKLKFQESKETSLIENNPYTKENFCGNNSICHYHTLTKLETAEIIKEDSIYHQLLEKLDLLFQVTEEEHYKNMVLLENLSNRLLHAIEYIDDEETQKIRNEVERIDFTRDCIAEMYSKIVFSVHGLQMINKIDDNDIEIIKRLLEFYQGVYKGLAHHCIGIYYYNIQEHEKTLEYFELARDIYLENNVSMGVINSYLIGVYKVKNNYLDTVLLCNEMEKYYKETNNIKRLMHVYNYMSDYYLLVNAKDKAEEYFVKSIDIINNNKDLERFKFILYFNWGFRCFKDFKFEDSLRYLKIAYDNNTNNVNRLKIINMLLIILTKLNDIDNIQKYVKEGDKYYSYGTEIDQIIFKYFNYKYVFNKYHRRYALDKIIPIFKNNPGWNEFLLFFYEDLYK